MSTPPSKNRTLTNFCLEFNLFEAKVLRVMLHAPTAAVAVEEYIFIFILIV